MRKEIYIDDFPGEDERPRRGHKKEYRFHGDGFLHQDKGRGYHLHGGRRDGHGPHLDEGCNTRETGRPHRKIYKHKFYESDLKTITKLFASKKELVEYVNKVGENGQQVDIFKIEDDLYKVVVYEKEVTKEVKEEE